MKNNYRDNLNKLKEQLVKGVKKVNNKHLLEINKYSSLVNIDKEMVKDFISEGYDIPFYPYINYVDIKMTNELYEIFDYLGIALVNVTICGLYLCPFISYKHEECQGVIHFPIENIIASLEKALNTNGILDEITKYQLEGFIRVQNEQSRLFSEKNYKSYFEFVLMTDKRQSIITFFDLLPTLEDNGYSSDDISSIFLEAYYTMDYNFDKIEWDLIDTHLENQTTKSVYHPSHINETHIANGYVTIYRSASDYSLSIKETRSWTLSKDIALKLAKRYVKASDKYLYVAKVSLEDIKAYIKNRNEEEVLVDYWDIEIIDKITI